MISGWPHFEQYIAEIPPGGKLPDECHLGQAVRGFFENGGHWCYVVLLEDGTAPSLSTGLELIASFNTIDLVCAPDLVHTDAVNGKPDGAFEQQQETVVALQQMVVDHCEMMNDRFAILDACYDFKASKVESNVQVWKQWSAIDGKNAALYYPWVKPRGSGIAAKAMPPCGHVAGVYARTDRQRGVHKAPANEVLEGVVDLERPLNNSDQDFLNPKNVNCLRSFPGRGIRVWGARTLSGQTAWTYVNVRRLFLTAVRWIEWNMAGVAFEPNSPSLWARIERQLRTFFTDLFRKGALKGRRPEESFYVKCDADTNPPEIVESGQVVTEIGLAPTVPYEFVVIRLIYGDRGVTISGPTQP
jgi:phage tail sheath protein FI